jgi:hypothetical protein
VLQFTNARWIKDLSLTLLTGADAAKEVGIDAVLLGSLSSDNGADGAEEESEETTEASSAE